MEMNEKPASYRSNKNNSFESSECFMQQLFYISLRLIIQSHKTNRLQTDFYIVKMNSISNAIHSYENIMHHVNEALDMFSI